MGVELTEKKICRHQNRTPLWRTPPKKKTPQKSLCPPPPFSLAPFPNKRSQVKGKLLGGKVHGSLARAGKVKGQTPKVEAEEKRKKKPGRAARRAQYNRRFVMTSSAFGGKKKGPNCQADRPEVIAAQAGKSGP